MIIDINQAKLALGNQYKIFMNSVEIYFASQTLLRPFPKITLVKSDHGLPRLVINRIPTLFKPKYEIELWDKNVVQYTTKSFWKNHFQCQAFGGLYEIFGHKGLRYSIFKDNKQIAWWDKKPVSWFDGDNYKITADDDCEVDLLIGFCLIHDNTSSTKNNNSVLTFDFGNIGPEARKFDEDWRPNAVSAR